jgi:hypothetical protein
MAALAGETGAWCTGQTFYASGGHDAVNDGPAVWHDSGGAGAARGVTPVAQRGQLRAAAAAQGDDSTIRIDGGDSGAVGMLEHEGSTHQERSIRIGPNEHGRRADVVRG